MCNLKLFLIILVYIVQSQLIGAADEPKVIKYSTAQQWAEKFGIELWNLGDYITRRKDVMESFKNTQIVQRTGSKIVEDISKEIKFMMDARISAIRRVVDTAQEIGARAAASEEIVEKNFTYYNSKEMVEPSEIPATESPNFMDSDEVGDKMEMPKPVIYLTESEKFGDYVNLTVSSVHVPANVYDRAKETIKAIKWSEELDSIFDSNYKRDQSLFWQYFCSSSGFLRQFPATKWKMDPVDLYDCRLRSWYIQAANSPKDIVIMIDNSGSMTGQRRDVARHVVESILDTLTSNDFVNIFTFSDELREVVECFGDTLVQANMANVRELKLALHNIETSELANFTAAFNRAFELLERYRTDRTGACCNQAIMLVSDGLPYPIDEVFETWNWQDKPYIPVRVFSYLIGREVADITDIKKIACDNQGYYVHLSTFAEVREEVIQYIPVMARPLVLNQTHPVVFSQLYADVIDPTMTDYEWECRERAKQRERFMVYRKNRSFMNLPEDPSNLGYDFIEDDDNERTKKFNFMTTVSIPVYDKRENATRIANLLGVAGADIPVNDIKKLMQPFLLGVGGYAFIVDNNGFILIHPDFRPVFYKDILKPAYNSVDMIEIELIDDDNEPREFNTLLLQLRESIINQSTGSKVVYQKYHFDRMRRASRMRRYFYWTEIKDTPFTLVVTHPELYGQYRLQTRSEEEIHRVNAKGTNVLNFFSGSNWKIHPDWLYCKHSNDTYSSPEAELLYFLERMRQPGWRWPLNRSPPPPEHVNIYTNDTSGKFLSDKDSYYCDRNLVQSLVYDAKITEWYSKNTSAGLTEKGNEFKQRFGVSVSFVATHSGLLRWLDHSTINEDIKPENEFSETNRKAIDEIWYKRAVEQHFIEPNSFVYAVPFDAANRNDTLVTGSHAVFHKENSKSAPAAVVGFQFQHSAMYTLFRNITGNCADSSCMNCGSDDFECFVLDDNGYVIVSPEMSDTGKFFGEVRGFLMHHLVAERVYKQIVIYDYQAICFVGKDAFNIASKILTPFKYIWELIQIISKQVVWLFLSVLLENTNAYGSYSYGSEPFSYETDYSPDPTERNDMPAAKNKEQEFDKRVLINRTRPERCDKIITLYQLWRPKEKEKSAFDSPMSSSCDRPFIAMPIPSSNMILIVASTLCSVENPIPFYNQPVEKHYNASSLQCYRLKSFPSYRRQLKHCFNKHLNESQIELCGKANKFYISFYILSLTAIVIVRNFI